MKYFDKEQAPMCLHVLGQDLVVAMHEEGRKLKAERDRLLIDIRAAYAVLATNAHRPIPSLLDVRSALAALRPHVQEGGDK